MSSQQEPTAVAVARAHVDAWGVHDYDVARGALAPEVHVIVTSVDPNTPQVDTTGADEYMSGLIQFGQGVLPGTTRVISAEVARAFLVPHETMAKRLTRAKRKITEARIPYRVPAAHRLGERLRAVLVVIYALFNEGYGASAGDEMIAGTCARRRSGWGACWQS
jgi:hypothetical protein